MKFERLPEKNLVFYSHANGKSNFQFILMDSQRIKHRWILRRQKVAQKANIYGQLSR